jgi:hypothetical protein
MDDADPAAEIKGGATIAEVFMAAENFLFFQRVVSFLLW